MSSSSKDYWGACWFDEGIKFEDWYGESSKSKRLED
jgi:hypothetical protein